MSRVFVRTWPSLTGLSRPSILYVPTNDGGNIVNLSLLGVTLTFHEIHERSVLVSLGHEPFPLHVGDIIDGDTYALLLEGIEK